jgi:hypothetical protein
LKYPKKNIGPLKITRPLVDFFQLLQEHIHNVKKLVYLNEQTAGAAANEVFPWFIVLALVWAVQVLLSSTEAKLRAVASNKQFHKHRS